MNSICLGTDTSEMLLRTTFCLESKLLITTLVHFVLFLLCISYSCNHRLLVYVKDMKFIINIGQMTSFM